jgi:hypothetical protein
MRELISAEIFAENFRGASTVVPPIMRSIGSEEDLAIEIPRYRMDYGYGKAVMRPMI